MEIVGVVVTVIDGDNIGNDGDIDTDGSGTMPIKEHNIQYRL